MFTLSGCARCSAVYYPKPRIAGGHPGSQPGRCNSDRLKAWLETGINRLSIGLQRLTKPARLDDRQHSAEDAAAAVHLAAEAGFTHISADLIYGLPNRTLSFEDELKQFVALPVDHLSAYILTVEDRTVLGRRVEQGAQAVPEDDAVEAEYRRLCVAMAEAGFEHYEVSNWAKLGGHAVQPHYWSGLPYWGIGPGAHGFDGARRYANVANNPKYIRALADASSAADVPSGGRSPPPTATTSP